MAQTTYLTRKGEDADLANITTTGGITTTGDLTLNGAIDGADVVFDASANLLYAQGPVRTQGFNALSPRYELKWVAGQRGKPSLNADIQNATEGTRMIADPDFEVLGTNASSDDVTFNAEGGLVIETDGGDNDQVIILPHLDANQSAWAQVTWGTDQATVWECYIKTSVITSATIWARIESSSPFTMAAMSGTAGAVPISSSRASRNLSLIGSATAATVFLASPCVVPLGFGGSGSGLTIGSSSFGWNTPSVTSSSSSSSTSTTGSTLATLAGFTLANRFVWSAVGFSA